MIILFPIPPFSHKILSYDDIRLWLVRPRFVFSSENCLFHQINRRATCSSKALLYTAIVIFNLFSLSHSWRSRFSLVHASLIQFVANGAAIKIDIRRDFVEFCPRNHKFSSNVEQFSETSRGESAEYRQLSYMSKSPKNIGCNQ